MMNLTDMACASFVSELAGILSDKARATDILRAVLNAGWEIRLDRVGAHEDFKPGEYRAFAQAPAEGKTLVMSSDRVDKLLELLAGRIKTAEDGPQSLYVFSEKYRKMADEAGGDGGLVGADEFDAAADACTLAAEAMAKANKVVAQAQAQATLKVIEEQRAARGGRNVNDYDCKPACAEEPAEAKVASVIDTLSTKNNQATGRIWAERIGGKGFAVRYDAPIKGAETRGWGVPEDPHTFNPPRKCQGDALFDDAETAIKWAERWRDEMLWLVIKEESGTNLELSLIGGDTGRGSILLSETVPGDEYDREGIMVRRYRGPNGESSDADGVGGFKDRREAAKFAIALVEKRKESRYQ